MCVIKVSGYITNYELNNKKDLNKHKKRCFYINLKIEYEMIAI